MNTITLLLIVLLLVPVAVTAETRFSENAEKNLVPEKYYMKGFQYMNARLYENSINCFSKAITLQPDFIMAYYNRGRSYHCHGRIEKAISDYSKVIAARPDFMEAYYFRGKAYHAKKMDPQAVQDFSAVIKMRPNLYEIYNLRGASFLSLAMYKEASEDFKMAIELNPYSVEAFYNNSCLYSRQNCSDLSILFLKKAIQLGFDDVMRLKKDPHLKSVRATSEFGTIIASLEMIRKNSLVRFGLR